MEAKGVFSRGYGFLEPVDPEFSFDILSRREFNQLSDVRPYVRKIYENTWVDQKIKDERIIFLQGHQVFVRDFINPTTPYTSLLLKYSTGAGKTNALLAIGMGFLHTKSHLEDKTPKVFILSFGKSVFINEILNNPIFELISNKEIDDLERYKELSRLSVANRAAYINYRKTLKMRLSRYFTFYGYKEFANRILLDENASHSKKADKAALLKKLENSIIMCDEIHHLYNSLEPNNYGLALAEVLETVPNVRTVFATATIANNSQTEVLDLLTLMNTTYGKKAQLIKSDYFELGGNLKPGAKERIAALCKGRVSFIEDKDPNLYPEQIIVGEHLAGVDYLKFKKCPMSKLHEGAYRQAQATYTEEHQGSHSTNDNLKEGSKGNLSVPLQHLPQDGKMLNSMIVPVPNKENGIAAGYLTKEIRHNLNAASAEWKQQVGIEYKNKIFSGTFLRIENIGQYSTKYHNLMADIITVNAADDGKILVFHPYVHNSGVTLIANMLQENGFIDEISLPGDDTRCSVCGVEQSKHQQAHNYIPARFLLLHSDMDPLFRENRLQLFNSPKNTNGHEYKILVGSRVIQEREDIKAVRHLFVLALPYNIPSLLQVFGRAVRRGSHELLPKEKWQVYITLYVSSFSSSSDFTYEEERYVIKMREYKVIQELEKIFNESAIDAQLFKQHIDEPQLTILPFKPAPVKHNGVDVPFEKLMELNETKRVLFNSLYARDEINKIKYMIRRIFVEKSRIFTKEDLMHELHNATFFVPFNTKMLSDDYITIALAELIYNHNKAQLPAETFVQSLLGKGAFGSQIIKTPDGADNVLIKTGPFYILSMLQKVSVQGTQYGVQHRAFAGFPILDIDSWQRVIKPPDNLKIKINSLRPSYDIQKREFFLRYNNVKVSYLLESINDFDMTFHETFIKEIIAYIFGILTHKVKVNEYHSFYMMMLYIYDKFGVIIFASYLRDTPLYANFEKYYGSSKDKRKEKKSVAHETGNALVLKRHSNFLSSRKLRKFKTINLRVERFNDLLKKTKEIIKVPDNYLPVGYLIKELVLYDEGTWKVYDTSINFEPKYSIENDIIVGFYEQSKFQLEMKFKLRPPKQFLVRFEDARRNERGAYCSTYSKKDLLAITSKLKIDTKKRRDDGKASDGNIGKSDKIPELCNLIRKELLHRELEERRRYWLLTEEEQRKHPIVRWFYLHFEKSSI